MTMETVNEEKISFVLYGSYEEQVNMLTDEQAGKLFKGVFKYVRTGEKQNNDPMVKLMLSVIGHQLDIDAQKYAEKIERRKEAGRKGGLQKAKNLANASNATNDVANLAVDVYVDEYEDADVDVDVDVLNKTGRRHRQEDAEDAYAREDIPVDNAMNDAIVYYADAPVPVLASEQDKYKTLANGLTRKYMNRSAKTFDIGKVIFYTSRMESSTDDVVYAAFDVGRAELLEYVFERAAEQEHMSWNYIDGIMDNYNRRNVNTVREAMLNEGMWHMGAISA